MEMHVWLYKRELRIWVCVCVCVSACYMVKNMHLKFYFQLAFFICLSPYNQVTNLFVDLYFASWFLLLSFLDSFYAVPWLYSQWVMDRFRALTPTFNEYQH